MSPIFHIVGSFFLRTLITFAGILSMFAMFYMHAAPQNRVVYMIVFVILFLLLLTDRKQLYFLLPSYMLVLTGGVFGLNFEFTFITSLFLYGAMVTFGQDESNKPMITLLNRLTLGVVLISCGLFFYGWHQHESQFIKGKLVGDSSGCFDCAY